MLWAIKVLNFVRHKCAETKLVSIHIHCKHKISLMLVLPDLKVSCIYHLTLVYLRIWMKHRLIYVLHNAYNWCTPFRFYDTLQYFSVSHGVIVFALSDLVSLVTVCRSEAMLIVQMEPNGVWVWKHCRRLHPASWWKMITLANGMDLYCGVKGAFSLFMVKTNACVRVCAHAFHMHLQKCPIYTTFLGLPV